jgi:class 3 adenylate cyclase
VEAPPLERKLAAILAADVEGYSRLMHEDEEATLATLSSHRSVVDELIAAGRGRISGTAGDSVLAEFASVVDAVRCAMAIQQALERANRVLAADRRMLLRIGINVGDVMVKDGDIFGDGVNVAARLEALADPGGICVTRGVRDHLRDRDEFAFDDLGEHAIKNIARPVRVFRVVFNPDGETQLGEDPELAPGPASAPQSPSEPEAVELALWQSVQASGQVREYEIYLERYPQGLFAELARARMSPPSPDPSSALSKSVEITFWETVRDSEDQAMLQAYIEKFPSGEFKLLAEIRLRDLACRN